MLMTASLGGSPFTSQCSLTFLQTFCSSAVFFLFLSFFLVLSHFLWPCLPHLKHCGFSFTISYLLNSLTPHCITLLVRASNLFIIIFFSSTLPLLFLQSLARWPNCLHPQHFLLSLSSSSNLVLVNTCQVLSILLRSLLYTSKDIVYCT